MADKSHIEWTDATWNIVTGCSVVSPGCTNCYAMKLSGTRLQNHPSRKGLTVMTKAGPVWNGEVRFNPEWLDQPIRWTKPRMIFVCAHGDLFHDGVTDQQLDQIFCIMAIARRHTFQVLTKRSARMRAYITALAPVFEERMWATGLLEFSNDLAWPLPNVWLGVSAEDQKRANERVFDLRHTPAAVRWISAEPLLSGLDLTRMDDVGTVAIDALRGVRVHPRDGLVVPGDEPLGQIDWVVVGGESGPGSRPMHPSWVSTIRDDCLAAGVAFHFKQWGNWAPMSEIDADALDGRLYHPAPARSPEGRRRPKTAQTVLHINGDRFDDVGDLQAFRSGAGGMLMFELGKALTGRTLQGRIHDGLPGDAEGRAHG